MCKKDTWRCRCKAVWVPTHALVLKTRFRRPKYQSVQRVFSLINIQWTSLASGATAIIVWTLLFATVVMCCWLRTVTVSYWISYGAVKTEPSSVLWTRPVRWARSRPTSISEADLVQLDMRLRLFLQRAFRAIMLFPAPARVVFMPWNLFLVLAYKKKKRKKKYLRNQRKKSVK